MSKYIINLVLALALGITGLYLGFVWFGWKLVLVIFLLLWSNNISNNIEVTKT